MKLGQYSGKNVRVALNSGQIFEGIGHYYTSELDNPDGVASICVGDYELYENEIARIETLSDTDSSPVPLAQDMQVAV